VNATPAIRVFGTTVTPVITAIRSMAVAESSLAQFFRAGTKTSVIQSLTGTR
jgi:hypothetical protein